MDIRTIVQPVRNYCEINREERNYAAILYAALCMPGNATKFLSRYGINKPFVSDFGIYYEYAYLRDLWYDISEMNKKSDIIRNYLPIDNMKTKFDDNLININPILCSGKIYSNTVIQYPGRWSVQKIRAEFDNDQDFIAVCKFKWAFNIKPDIVIHLDNNNALCIEAKYESKESSYPSDIEEKKIFRKCGLSPVKQFELQKYLMEELLGFTARYIIISNNNIKNATHKFVSWATVFDGLDMSDMPPFAGEMIKRISA